MRLRRETACTETSKACVGKAAEILGNKWSTGILYALSDGPKRFGVLRAAAGNPNPRTFSARLCALEAAGVIDKQSYSEIPPRVEYRLTAKGRELLPIFEQMRAWGAKHAYDTQSV